ncbi:MAG: competence/damage-inducible protein A [Gammaproteobacteria bacterium]|jgi:molybdenum cofactor synthesis domain-containing protein|nr:competence/damage-inducible protein A [Gammaproteobacteria bacterium]MBT4495069.1 competence/damage-inducible protein A [Gammaproteobacteria bacterium]MBT7372081.1 competence/damage-inducible protein A [Gammaproteobacteria bacterium]
MSKTVTGCLLIIGNEILSGRTQDTNLAHLARELNEVGVRMVHARVIPDVEDIIVNTVNECRALYNHVFTTGGIGPTHDDITADCIARAFNTELYFHPDVVEIINRRKAPPDAMEARLRMARIPKGATLIDNPTGGPPGFQMENVYVMAGVPMVMQAMVSTLTKERLGGGDPVRSRSVGVYLGESTVAADLREIQGRYPEIDLGSYPFYREDGYGTNLVMRGTNETELDEMLREIESMIRNLGAEPFYDQ